MGTQEWLLLGVVLVVPLLIAIAVTLWTLEQALKRNRKNRPDRVARRVSEPVPDAVVIGSPSATDRDTRERGDARPAETQPVDGAPASSADAPGGGFTSGGGSGGDGGSSSDGGGGASD